MRDEVIPLRRRRDCFGPPDLAMTIGDGLAMTAERHLLGVWNPSYAVDAMDAHLRVLLDNIANFRSGKVKEEEVHVWWGKVAPNPRPLGGRSVAFRSLGRTQSRGLGALAGPSSPGGLLGGVCALAPNQA